MAAHTGLGAPGRPPRPGHRHDGVGSDSGAGRAACSGGRRVGVALAHRSGSVVPVDAQAVAVAVETDQPGQEDEGG